MRSLLFLIFIFTGSLNAAPLTFPDLIDIALENHPDTRAVWWRAKRAESLVGQAQSAYYPQVGIETSVTHGREFRYINGPDVNYTYLSADLVLGWMLYDFGMRAAEIEAAKWALIAADWQYNLALQKVILEVLSRGYSVLHAEEALEASLISSREAAFMQKASQELYHAGLISISDVETADATYSQMQITLLERRHHLEVEKGRLAITLGRCAGEKLELEKITHVPPVFCQLQEDLVEIALQRRGDWMAKQAKVLEYQNLERKTKAEYCPKLYFSAKGGGDRAVHDKANGLHYGISLNFDLPLFDGFENCYKLQARRADVLISEEELAALNLEIAFEILNYTSQLKTLQEMYAHAGTYLAAAEKAYRGKMEMYQVGEEGIFEVSNALKQLAEARIVLSDIKTRMLTSSVYLAFSTGALLEEDSCY